MFEHQPLDRGDFDGHFDGHFDGSFECWLAGELRRPAPAAPARVARIMARVRAVPAPMRRRRWAPPLLGLAAAAGLAGLVAVRPAALTARPHGAAATAVALRDTMAASLRDTIRGVVRQAVRDSVRLVQFAFVAPRAARVALAGDFNRWSPRAMPLARRAADGAWTGTVALAPGRHRYAFVVDDSVWLADPSAPGDDPGPWSVLTVRDSAN